MSRYLIGACVLGADDVTNAVVLNAAEKAQAKSSSSDSSGTVGLIIAGIVAVIAWPLIKKWL